ncbi:MAG: rhamnogalacturonate lyase [Clostridiales bacterium]|nr:rhamnogalacturonate lyase [Clostridiales bacterium]
MVQLKVEGKRCEMSNGLISIRWKEDGSVESLKKGNKELIKDLDGTSTDSNAKRTFYCDYHAEGKFHKMTINRLDVITNTDEMAHIAYIDTQGLLYIEYHIIMMKGVSGIYTYLVAGNNTDSDFALSEFRIVYRFGNKIFDHACNSERIGLQPTHKYMEQFEWLQDETYRLPDGEKYTNGDVYQKYDYASYFSTNPAFGQFGHGYGFFIIPVSTEYYPGGPLKQELLVHYDGIVLNYFTGAHFGTGTFYVPQGWKKFYGPYLVYLNEGDDGEALYQDALNKAKEEQKKWPYQWVSHPLYPLNRTQVKGRLTFSDGKPCSNTTVILGKPGITFERQTAGYLFYTTTEDDGTFTIDNVRPDTYTLYGYHTGGHITEQLQIDGILVDGEYKDLGELIYEIPNNELIWQLGKATRTSDGFKYSGELRNYKWMHMVPENLTFTIGKDNEASDWYYAQTKQGEWKIKFNMDEASSNKYILTVALAGICKANMTNKSEPYIIIKINDTIVKEATFLNDASVYRSATRNGRYRKLDISFDSSYLQKGENTVSIINTNCMIMYDTVKLEKVI